MSDLGIDEKFRPLIQHYIKFFEKSKQRTQAFYDLEIENYTQASFELGLMCVLCKCRLPSIEEIARCVLMGGDFENNPLLAEFEKYDLLKSFWGYCEAAFGYVDDQPCLNKFAMTLFATYADKTVHSHLPQAWQPFISFKDGTISAFLDDMMNSVIYHEKYDELSKKVYKLLDGDNQLKSIPVDVLAECNLFSGIDRIVLD